MDLALMVIWFVFLIAWAAMYKSGNKNTESLGRWQSWECGYRLPECVYCE